MANLFARLPNTLRRSPVEVFGIVTVIVILSYVIVPLTAGAKSTDQADADRATALSVAAMQNQTVPFGQLPQANLRGPFYTLAVTASAYNSLPWQTDATPFITASGTHVRPGVIAANFLPIGTQITIPDIYGDQVFTVEDRMNPRYTKNIDIWMSDLNAARHFGRRTVRINVYTGK